MSDSNSSSLKAYADSAVASGQSVLSKITGSAGDQVDPQTSLFSTHSHTPTPQGISPPSISNTQPPPPLLPHPFPPSHQPPPPQSTAAATKSAAASEKEASHSVGKVGPLAFSPSGGVAADDPNRSEGNWNQTIGSGKEALGGLLGAEGLKMEGERQNKEGRAQEARGQVNDFGSGVEGRVHGE